MCGISGIVDLTGAPVPLEPSLRMMKALQHRGPDSQGMFMAPGISLGATRLAIIDSQRGDQPMKNAGKALAVVHNGEIYNHGHLRRTLSRLGYRFSSACDTEVILHAFDAWCESALPRFQGMFSFAIAGAQLGAMSDGRPFLLLARDPVGIKPLYYYRENSWLLFASELRALLASGLIPLRLSPSGLNSYLRSGSVLEPDTLIERIHVLPPGHYLTVRNGKLQTSLFTRLQAESSNFSLDHIHEDVLQWIESAVASQLEGDEPPGIFLSGGLDSAVVASLAAKHHRSVLRTVSLSFDEPQFDEAIGAAETARFLGTNHHSIKVTQEAFLDDLEEVMRSMDQPTVDGVNSWWIAREARRLGIRTALSGLGGDELFAGYATFGKAAAWRHTRALVEGIPEVLRHTGYRGLAFLGGQGRYTSRLADFLTASSFSHPYFVKRSLFGPTQIKALLGGADPVPSRDLRARIESCTRQALQLDPIGEISYLELTHYTLNRLLRDTDMMSMAHGLEVRVPLLDFSLVTRVLGLPGEVKWRSGRNKPLLLRACKDLLPPHLHESRKRPFTFPWEIWLRGPLGREVAASLERSDTNGFLDHRECRRIWHDFSSGRLNWSRPWSIFVLKKWI
ncbi:MAG TPA: asparagine synthase (glutamine-hydrolyzing), partial [Acidobacteriota bacterium]|nr:asparagine synthase (glutamine-hydrolyzing) [Acidobacteriota bacterium]